MIAEHSGATRHDIVMTVANMPKADVALYFQMCWACLDAARETKRIDYENLGEYTCAVMRSGMELN